MNIKLIMICTVVSVILIETLLANFRLKRALRRQEKAMMQQQPQPISRAGFIDYKTGRRVEIDPVTKRERFVV